MSVDRLAGVLQSVYFQAKHDQGHHLVLNDIISLHRRKRRLRQITPQHAGILVKLFHIVSSYDFVSLFLCNFFSPFFVAKFFSMSQREQRARHLCVNILAYFVHCNCSSTYFF